MQSYVYPTIYYIDGSEIRRSPVEVGSFPHYLVCRISSNSITEPPNDTPNLSDSKDASPKELATATTLRKSSPRPDALSFPSLLSRLRDFSLRSYVPENVPIHWMMNKIDSHHFLCPYLELYKMFGANGLDSKFWSKWLMILILCSPKAMPDDRNFKQIFCSWWCKVSFGMVKWPLKGLSDLLRGYG